MMKKRKILTVFGTRPEVIKLAPLIKAIEADKEFTSITCATTQHTNLQNDVLELFGIKPDYDLKIMQEGQDLYHITETVLNRIKKVLDTEKPDYTVVQGDTTTAFAAALASFYQKIPVIHIEAGLRTGNMYSPFPEEVNRCLISRLATLHMAPTKQAVQNLAQEGITQNVHNIGNTIVDAVEYIKNEYTKTKHDDKNKTILVTAHRRENFGEPLQRICAAIREIAIQHKEYTFIWPVHPNPNVKKDIYKTMEDLVNVSLRPPVSYGELIHFISQSDLVLSDSGGIQEESCILGKRILILREETERPEVVEMGFGVLVGSDPQKIIHNFNQLINEKKRETETLVLPYGKAGVSKRILNTILLHSRSSASTPSSD